MSSSAGKRSRAGEDVGEHGAGVGRVDHVVDLERRRDQTTPLAGAGSRSSDVLAIVNEAEDSWPYHRTDAT